MPGRAGFTCSPGNAKYLTRLLSTEAMGSSWLGAFVACFVPLLYVLISTLFSTGQASRPALVQLATKVNRFPRHTTRNLEQKAVCNNGTKWKCICYEPQINNNLFNLPLCRRLVPREVYTQGVVLISLQPFILKQYNNQFEMNLKTTTSGIIADYCNRGQSNCGHMVQKFRGRLVPEFFQMYSLSLEPVANDSIVLGLTSVFTQERITDSSTLSSDDPLSQGHWLLAKDVLLKALVSNISALEQELHLNVTNVSEYQAVARPDNSAHYRPNYALIIVGGIAGAIFLLICMCSAKKAVSDRKAIKERNAAKREARKKIQKSTPVTNGNSEHPAVQGLLPSTQTEEGSQPHCRVGRVGSTYLDEKHRQIIAKTLKNSRCEVTATVHAQYNATEDAPPDYEQFRLKNGVKNGVDNRAMEATENNHTGKSDRSFAHTNGGTSNLQNGHAKDCTEREMTEFTSNKPDPEGKMANSRFIHRNSVTLNQGHAALDARHSVNDAALPYWKRRSPKLDQSRRTKSEELSHPVSPCGGVDNKAFNNISS